MDVVEQRPEHEKHQRTGKELVAPRPAGESELPQHDAKREAGLALFYVSEERRHS